MKHASLTFLVALLACACGAPVDPTDSSSALQAEPEPPASLGIAWRKPELAWAVCDAATQCQAGDWSFDFRMARWEPGQDCPFTLAPFLDGGYPAAAVQDALEAITLDPCAPLPPDAL